MYELRLFEVRVRAQGRRDPATDPLAAIRRDMRPHRRAWFWLLGLLWNSFQRYQGHIAKRTYGSDAEKGDPAAQFNLGHACYLSAWKTGDYTEALYWIEKAAAQDYASALRQLGYIYESGHGVAVDLAEAKRWFRKAAEQGDPFDQYNYAGTCLSGDFGSRNADEFEQWILKAAEQGDPEAQSSLGRYCERGTRRDLAQAFMWYTLSALHHTSLFTPKNLYTPKTAREARDRIAAEMSPEEIAAAETRTQRWLEQHAAVMGEHLVKDWRDSVAEPFTEEESAEIAKFARAWWRNRKKP